jgi:farnesyl diphosphate synthase
MAGGQALDLDAEHTREPLSRPDIERLQAMKTGALLGVSVASGAIMGRADDGQRAALARFGRALGAAFQIADDILDATGDEATLGKKAGKDAGRNKATLVASLGLEEAQAVCTQLVAEAQDALAGFGAHGAVLRQAAAFVSARKS